MDLDLDEAAAADNDGSVSAADERSLLRRRPSRLVMMSSIYVIGCSCVMRSQVRLCWMQMNAE